MTLALVLRRVLPASELPGYWLAQLAGATLASLVGAWASGKEFGVHPDPSTPIVTAFVLEFLFTFLLVLVVLNVGKWTGDAGQVVTPVAVAATVVGALYATGPIASAALNPAVATGPVVLDGNLGSLLFYWGATLLAAAAAAAVSVVQERDGPAA